MKKVRIMNLEKKMNKNTRRQHRKIEIVHEQTRGGYTTSDGRSLTKHEDGSFFFEDGTVHYNANKPNPYNEISLILRRFVSPNNENRID